MVKEGLYYTKSHEWVRIEGDEAYIGISAYAAHEMGDIVYVELPEEGEEVTAGEAFGSVEAVKAVEDVNAPMSGVILEINEELEDAPELVGKDAYGDGWMIHIKISDMDELDQLLDADAYAELLEEL
ncbi:MAG: glycine cleavage system protein GcvH [Candidatus Cloacimonetes bacterium]|nr:glycine cleavage system protein GcvH [Candidatus Cloacimonadota bacterium]